jgi:hypothetical protein
VLWPEDNLGGGGMAVFLSKNRANCFRFSRVMALWNGGDEGSGGKMNRDYQTISGSNSMTWTLKTIAVLACLMCLVSQARGDIIADSVSHFSGTQGQDGWYYGYSSGPFTGTNFTLMTQFAPSEITSGDSWYVQEGTYWTQLSVTGAHGNGTTTSGGRTPTEQWAVREWVSNVAGDVTISGSIAKLITGGNGVTADIFVVETKSIRNTSEPLTSRA